MVEKGSLQIEHKTLNERAYERIKKALASGDFKPGEPLVIRLLAEAYGISATPVREALQRLVAEQSLVLQPNRSISVPVLTLAKFEELRQIRCALEGLAAELAAPRLLQPAVKKLEAIATSIDGNIESKNTSAYVLNNQKFHFLIYEHCEAEMLLQMIQTLWVRVGPYFYGLFEDTDYLEHANDGHRAIIAAIKSGKPVALRNAVVADINDAGASLMPRLRELTK